jgi:hypothetical protein
MYYFTELNRIVDMAAKRKTRSYKVWTSDDLKTLKKHSREKTPVTKIAKSMRRSAPTIRQKASSLGISVGHRRRAA